MADIQKLLGQVSFDTFADMDPDLRDDLRDKAVMMLVSDLGLAPDDRDSQGVVIEEDAQALLTLLIHRLPGITGLKVI